MTQQDSRYSTALASPCAKSTDLRQPFLQKQQQVYNSSYLTEGQVNRSEAIVGLQQQQQHPGHLKQQLCNLGGKHLRGLLNGFALLFITGHVQMINVLADDLQSKGSHFDTGSLTYGDYDLGNPES